MLDTNGREKTDENIGHVAQGSPRICVKRSNDGQTSDEKAKYAKIHNLKRSFDEISQSPADEAHRWQRLNSGKALLTCNSARPPGPAA